MIIVKEHQRTCLQLCRAIFLFFCVIIFICADSALAQVAAPRLALAETEFDFGTVEQGSIVEHSFEMINKGEAPLKVTKLHPDCGCTAVTLDSDTIAPGAQTAIKVSFNTAGFQGSKVKTIRIYTDDPQQTSAVLVIKGTIRPDVQVEPTVIDFGDVREGEEQKLDAYAFVEGASSTKLLDVRSHTADLEVVGENYSDKGRSGMKITATLKGSASQGSFRGRIALRTTSTKDPVVSIPVLARIEGDLQLIPAALMFGTLSGLPKGEVVKSAILRNRGDAPVHILSAKTDNRSVTVQIQPLEEGREYKLIVSLMGESPEMIRSRVKITTDHSDQKQKNLVLPVYAIITAKSE
jgi:hypothetical protein